MATRPRVSTDEVDFESVSNFGTVTAPGAGAAIVTIAAGSLPRGYYDVCVEACHAGGTPAAAEDGNFVIRRAAATLKRMATTRVAGQQYTAQLKVFLDGTQALSVNTNGAATASVVYVASITATKVSA